MGSAGRWRPALWRAPLRAHIRAVGDPRPFDRRSILEIRAPWLLSASRPKGAVNVPDFRPVLVGALALACAAFALACGGDVGVERTPGPNGVVSGIGVVLTAADTDRTIEIPVFPWDLNRPGEKGLLLRLAGEDASSLRWRFAEKPSTAVFEWHAVDDRLAFETDGLIGDPATAPKLLEFRGNGVGEGTIVVELVERDPADRAKPPAERLTYHIRVVPGCVPSTGSALC